MSYGQQTSVFRASANRRLHGLLAHRRVGIIGPIVYLSHITGEDGTHARLIICYLRNHPFTPGCVTGIEAWGCSNTKAGKLIDEQEKPDGHSLYMSDGNQSLVEKGPSLGRRERIMTHDERKGWKPYFQRGAYQRLRTFGWTSRIRAKNGRNFLSEAKRSGSRAVTYFGS
ncbi:hypothetical protein C8R44DRAFT_737209 [Mycena epipterygia]|nr:hypothetical protein C8R44DRAFT_737209 [Mycena epipterygia]